MDNITFLEELKTKRGNVLAQLNGDAQLSDRERASLKEQEGLLSSAIKIMTYGTGAERRRFRRDYQRRLQR